MNLILLIFIPAVSHSNELIIEDQQLRSEQNTNGGIREYDGFTIVHVKGSYYDMGFQYGSLLNEKCLQLYRAKADYAEKNNLKYEDLVEHWNYIKQFIPIEHLHEMQGLADALDLPIDYIGAYQLSKGYNIPIFNSFIFAECSSIVGWGPATSDGKMYCGQSYDNPIWLRDPESGVYIPQENLVILIREPDDGFATMCINVAGYLAMLDGFNEQGLVLTVTAIDSNEVKGSAMPITELIKYILDRSSTTEDAINYILENKKKGFTITVSDYKIPVSYVVEVTANHSYVGAWDDPVESSYPFWEINHVIRRVNLFHNQTLAETQRKRFNPDSFLRWLKGINKHYPNWRHYEALSQGIETFWGNLNHNTMMKIFRHTYSGKIDLLFFLATSLHLLEVWYQWVFCPETGDMWFTLAKDGKSAFKNEIYKINMYDFLD